MNRFGARLAVLLSLVQFSGGCVSRVAAPASSAPSRLIAQWTPELADTLKQLGREDQEGRDELSAEDTASLFRTMRADSVRSLWLRRLAQENGWPTRATVGDSAAEAAWLILQHSPFHDWQEQMLPVLEQLAGRGELDRREVALLTDRVLAHRGMPQRYGTQFDMVDGRLVAHPIGELAQLDARRAAVGLPPMAEYVRQLGEAFNAPVVWPPTR